MRARWWVIGVATVCLGGCGASPSTRSQPEAPPSAVVLSALTAPRLTGASLFVRLMIHSRRYLFLIDTGAGSSVIASSVATALHLPPADPPRKAPTFGCRASVRPVRIDHWAIGSRRLPAMTIASQDLPTVMVDGLRLSGLLGTNLLARFGTLTLSYADGRVVLGGAVPTSRHEASITIVRRGPSALIDLRATVAGAPTTWLLDTGSASTVIAAPRADALGLRPTGAAQTRAGAAGCTATVTPVRISRWHVGSVRLPPTIALASGSPVITHPEPGRSTAGLIGADVLASFGSATVDFKDHRLILGGS